MDAISKMQIVLDVDDARCWITISHLRNTSEEHKKILTYTVEFLIDEIPTFKGTMVYYSTPLGVPSIDFNKLCAKISKYIKDNK